MTLSIIKGSGGKGRKKRGGGADGANPAPGGAPKGSGMGKGASEKGEAAKAGAPEGQSPAPNGEVHAGGEQGGTPGEHAPRHRFDVTTNLKPDMTATVMLQTGKRTNASYPPNP